MGDELISLCEPFPLSGHLLVTRYGHSRLTEELCIDPIFSDGHDEITPIVAILPLQDWALIDARSRIGVRAVYGFPIARGGDGRSRELDPESSRTGRVIIFFLAEPDQIGDLLRIPRFSHAHQQKRYAKKLPSSGGCPQQGRYCC